MTNIYITGIDLSDDKRVLLIAPEDMTAEEGMELKNILGKRFPGCEFVVLTGDFKLIATNNIDVQYEIEA